MIYTSIENKNKNTYIYIYLTKELTLYISKQVHSLVDSSWMTFKILILERLHQFWTVRHSIHVHS